MIEMREEGQLADQIQFITKKNILVIETKKDIIMIKNIISQDQDQDLNKGINIEKNIQKVEVHRKKKINKYKKKIMGNNNIKKDLVNITIISLTIIDNLIIICKIDSEIREEFRIQNFNEKNLMMI